MESEQHDDWAVVMARWPLGEFLHFMKTVAGKDPNNGRGELIHEWRDAATFMRELEEKEAGIADDPEERPLPAEGIEYAKKLFSESAAQRAFQFTPHRWSLVELDRLTVFQPHINLRFVSELDRSLPSVPTIFDLIDMSMGQRTPRPAIHVRRRGQNSFSVFSSSEELVCHEAALLDPSVIAHLVAGHVGSVIGFPIGFGTNVVSAVSLGRRLALINGSHRAFELRQHGLTHAPCLVLDASREGDLDLLTGETQKQIRPLLKMQRPPLFKDYFDERLRKVVPIPRSYPLIEIQITVQRHRAPALQFL